MTIEHCPNCCALSGAEGTVIRSDGKQEALYRCGAHGCHTMFSHALPTSSRSATRVETYRDAQSSQTVIRTDC
ncbi:hypothetical protein CJO78_04585 [Ralstonia solanacearum]|nr:hypothetical protein CJO78_04585 [Ralstonia solanacearum]AXW05139.1 hypothetical protein CJO82_04360 [Ralstonia solanacearum]AXW22883.1 hypothetical protein CJO86_04385 [Ralstonia solanacearum]AXW79830.1 hypothetical protein CJO98_04605 [Ralstonia solanacearum]